MNALPPRHARPLLAALIAAGALPAGLSTAFAQEAQGRVVSSTPVIQQVAVPRQVCSDETVIREGRPSGAGALLGAVAGGAAGNAIGNGSGRAAATVIGLIGGAVVGNRIEGPGESRTEVVRQCGTQTFYESRTVAYDVVYEYGGQQFRTQMPHDPGRFVRLSVTPVDALPSAPPPGVYPARPQVIYQTAPARVVVENTVVPTYPVVGGGIVYINGQGYHRPPPGGWDGHRHGWRGDDRWDDHPRHGERWQNREERWHR